MTSVPSPPPKKKNGKNKPHLCSLCDLSFRRPIELDKHIQLVHEGYRYKCFHCGVLLQTQLRRHLLYRCTSIPALVRSDVLITKTYDTHFHYHVPPSVPAANNLKKWNLNTNAPNQRAVTSSSSVPIDITGNLFFLVDSSGQYTSALIRDLAADPTLVDIDPVTGLLSTTHAEQVIYSSNGSVVTSSSSHTPVDDNSAIVYSIDDSDVPAPVPVDTSSGPISISNIDPSNVPPTTSALPHDALLAASNVDADHLDGSTMQCVLSDAMVPDFLPDVDFSNNFDIDPDEFAAVLDLASINVDIDPEITTNTAGSRDNRGTPVTTIVNMPLLGSPPSFISPTESPVPASPIVPKTIIKKRKRSNKSRTSRTILMFDEQCTSVYICLCGGVPPFEEHSSYVTHLLELHGITLFDVNYPLPIEPDSVVIRSSRDIIPVAEHQLESITSVDHDDHPSMDTNITDFIVSLPDIAADEQVSSVVSFISANSQPESLEDRIASAPDDPATVTDTEVLDI